MKLLVTGSKGQVARSLIEAAKAAGLELVALGRPEFDLTDPQHIEQAMTDISPDYVVNAAAYTAVDKAEQEGETAIAVNRYGAGVLAAVCKEHGVPLVHLSTDYVFDGSKPTPYTEADKTAPLGMYGHSKLEGEKAVVAANPHSIILRTAWVFSPFGHNFVKTMLRLAETRDELSVVDDQHGCPSYAPHLAKAILDIVVQLEGGGQPTPWGTYNLVGDGETTWCGFAREIFAQSKKRGGPSAEIHAIGTADYPTPAKRPANSRLDGSKMAQEFGIILPDWRKATADCVDRLLEADLS